MQILLLLTSIILLLPSFETTFTNPIVDHGPDPWMQYYEGYYYYAATTFGNKITMRKSKTLAGIHSAAETTVFNLPAGSGCCNMWAPEFHLLNSTNGERWYMYYVAGSGGSDYAVQKIHVLESSGKDPMGPYTFKADFRDPSDDTSFELDPSILKVDGKLYLLGTYIRNAQDIFIRPLSNPWTASGKKVQISHPEKSWETGVNEGPEPLYHNGKTMIVYSGNNCKTPDYLLGMLTLTGSDPLNPAHWTKYAQPILKRDDANHVYGPGHNGFFKSPDGKEDWIVYHANNSTSGSCDGNRSSRAQKFTWTGDVPNIGNPVATGTSLESPSGE